MPGWQNSDRRDRLPPDWPKLRAKRLKLDGHQCQHRNVYGEACLAPAVDVDHMVRGDDHRIENLRSLCEYHHDKKSGAEGAAAAAAKRRRIAQRFRRTETHPGLL